MYNCLVTRLKEVVNDNSLPLFINISDYEEFISASGNTGMTDAQKLAVAEAFALIGAKSNGTIWNKIKYLYLPILSADLAHSLVEYKTKVALTPADYVAFANHGIYATDNTNQAITIPSLKIDDLSIFWMRSGNLASNSSTFQVLNILTSSFSHISHTAEMATLDKIAIIDGSNNTVAEKIGIVKTGGLLKGLTIDGTDVYVLDNAYTKVADDQDTFTGTVANANVRLFSYGNMNKDSAITGSVLIIADAMTSSEVSILKNAMEKLAESFL